MGEAALERFGLDKVLYIPAGQPPHKAEYPVSNAEDRYAMALLGTATNPAFEVSRIEIERTGPSYSVDTIRQIRGIYGPDSEIYFILGTDEAVDITTWHEAHSLPDLTRFAVVSRPGFGIEELRTRIPERFYSAFSILPMPVIGISSTEIRERIASGRSIRYMTPEPVEAYIRKRELYEKGSTYGKT
jgi:nicotinate-nucleotide adenylyltransferase